MARSPLTDEHKEAISKGLRASEKADHYHKHVQTGRKRQPFTLEWRAKLSVSRRFPNLDKDSEEYRVQVEKTIADFELRDRITKAIEAEKETN